MKEIPLLTPRQIELRVQRADKDKNNKPYVMMLLYKDARTDMEILDSMYGVTGWQRTHEVINENLFCNIDIWDDEKKVWVRKQDVGIESNTQAEKGEASDSFKRASFNIGIGRELYSDGAKGILIYLNDNEHKDGKPKSSFKLHVSNIDYNKSTREIIGLEIQDSKNNIRYSYGTLKGKKLI